jgi:transcriptional regulator GlxA family with amidase domain
MIYVAPSAAHAFRSAREKGERLIALIEPAAWRRAGGGPAATAIVPASQLVKELLFYLLLHPTTKHASALVDVFCRTLAETLAAPPPSSAALAALADAPRARPELRKALELARAHCTEDFSVAELARRSGLSARNLSRLFQVELGTTPKHLLMALRIERARELLTAGDRTVTEVAFSVGYGSLSQFIAAFRQLTGQLPSELAAPARAGRKPQ